MSHSQEDEGSYDSNGEEGEGEGGEEEEEEDRSSYLVKLKTEPYANRVQHRTKKIYITQTKGYKRFSGANELQCRQRIQELHRVLAKDTSVKEIYPDAFDAAPMDDPISVNIEYTSFVRKTRTTIITDKLVEDTVARAMYEITFLQCDSMDAHDAANARDVRELGRRLMLNHGVSVRDGRLTCSRTLLHWIRLDGLTKYFNVHNREQLPPTKAQLAERKWPLHPLFVWLYATRPLLNNPHLYAYSKDYGLFDAMQLRSFVVILASLCNVNEWYIDVEQMENALWKPREKDKFEIYNHIHRFVDMFYHTGEVFVDAIVNHGLAATVGRFLTMRAARYMRRAYYDVMRNWHMHHARMGAYGDFMRQHHWVVAHFLIAPDDTPEILSSVNDEYVDLKALLGLVAVNHKPLFRRLHEKNADLYPETTGDIEEFVVRFYRMSMDMFRLHPRLALMGISSLAHDLTYLQDRKISVVIPGDFYVDRNFERYDLLGQRWNADPKAPMPTPEELLAFRRSVQDPTTVDVLLAPPDEQTASTLVQDDDDEYDEKEKEEEDLELIRYKRRKRRQDELARAHPDLQFGREETCLYAAFETDGVLVGLGESAQHIIEEVPAAPPEKDALAANRLENAMRRYFAMVFGEVPNLEMYSIHDLPEEYHRTFLQKYSVHQKQYRDSEKDPDSREYFDTNDMELMYNALFTIPRKTFVRFLPDGRKAQVTLDNLPEELGPKDICVEDDDEPYEQYLPNALMRHAFFQNYVVAVPHRWRRPMLHTMRLLKSGIAHEHYLRLDADNEAPTPITDATGRSEFLRRLIRQHRPDHERCDLEEYVLPFERGTKRKLSERDISHAMQSDRRADLVNAHNYKLAVDRDGGEVADFRFNPRFDHLFPLGMLVAVLEQEGSVRKLVSPSQVQMIPFVELDEPANASPCIDTVPYLTMKRVNLPVYVTWAKETNMLRDLSPPSRVLGFFDSFFVFSKNNTFTECGIFQRPPIPTREEEEAKNALSERVNK